MVPGVGKLIRKYEIASLPNASFFALISKDYSFFFLSKYCTNILTNVFFEIVCAASVDSRIEMKIFCPTGGIKLLRQHC